MSIDIGTYYAYVEYPRACALHEYRNVICVEVLDPDAFDGGMVAVRRVDGRSWANEHSVTGRRSRERLARPEQLVSTWGEYTRAITEAQVRENREAEQAEHATRDRRNRIEAAASYFQELPASSKGFPDLAAKIKRDLLRSGGEGVTLTLDEVLGIARRFEEHEAIITQNAILDYPEPEPEEEADAAT